MIRYQNSRRAGARGIVVAAGLLAAMGIRALPAQDTGAAPDSVPMTLVIAVFPGPAGADSAMSAMQSGNGGDMGNVHSYSVVSKNKDGTVKTHKHKKKDSSASSARAEQAITGAVALLGHPADNPAGAAPSRSAKNSSDSTNSASYGASNPSGATSSGISQAGADKMQGMLQPDNSAIILVVPTADVNAMNTSLQQANPSQVMDIELVPVAVVGP
jgi:hypothetical protein